MSIMRCVVLQLFLVVTVAVNGQTSNFPDCKSGPLMSFPICDQSLPTRQRAVDLVNRMTTHEKLEWLVDLSNAIPRLGMPKYRWWSEALHGVMYWDLKNDLPPPTSFPIPLNLAASFNMSLVRDVGTVISTEARAANNENRVGLNFFTPNINIFRDPRWGRGQETPGEDPFLTSQYAYAMVRALQGGDDESYLKVAATCKHFDAYDLENWEGITRWHFDAKVSDQDLVETYLPPFESCIRDARAASIMCSFNAINGIPACAHQFLIQTIARTAFHLDGFVIGDCRAVENIMLSHNYTSTVQDTVAVALHAGTDMDCGGFYLQHAEEALSNNTIVEGDIDQALQRILNVLVRLGWFDPPEQQPYRNLTRASIDTTEARQLAFKSAQESIVLLKNMNKALPLNVNKLINKKIALIGPTANATVLMQGSYHGVAPFLIDPITGFKVVTANKSIDIEYSPGCAISGSNETGFAAAIELARSADIVFFFGGQDQSIEREGVDRTTIGIPDLQMSLLQQIEKVVRSSLHVVIMSGSGMDLSYIRDSSQYASLIWAGYPGQAGGYALATVIFGQYNPAGRLPITFYPASYVDNVSMFDMQMRPSSTNPGRSYKFYTGQAVYEFGYGLSYTTFLYAWYNDSTISSYSIESLMKDNADTHRVFTQSFCVNVTNTGTMEGDDVVLAFVTPPQAVVDGQTPPIKQLFGFARVHLNVNETKQVFFPFGVQTLLAVAPDGSKWLHSGKYDIIIGRQPMYTIELYGNSVQWEQFR